jgi:uncharacterized protein (DUF1800 family)
MTLDRRQFLRSGAGASLALAAGCDVPKGLQTMMAFAPAKAGATGPFSSPQLEELDAVSHALNRATFGARPGDYQRVRALGATPEAAARAFLEEQLNPERVADDRAEWLVARFETLREPLGELFEYRERILIEEIQRATLMRAIASERQLFEVMVQFWSDHFNIDPSKADCGWTKTADDRDVTRAHALGNFGEMLRASALSPAMLCYLDGRENRKARPEDRPNENYARELLELHTLGVHGGYTQQDVMEVARCLTGWTVRGPGSKKFWPGLVEFKPHLHDKGSKVVLGKAIPEWPASMKPDAQVKHGEWELERVLEIVLTHPSTARYIAMKLCRRFISDDPPAAAVDAVSSAFTRTGGSIRPMLRALFDTPEFWSSRGGKLKRPFHFIVSALRATGADTDAPRHLVDVLLRMGHAPFTYPTPDGFPEEASPWLGTLLWRWNFAIELCEGRVARTKVNLDALRTSHGGDEGLMAHLLGRKPGPEHIQCFHESGTGVALLLASPAFQRC